MAIWTKRSWVTAGWLCAVCALAALCVLATPRVEARGRGGKIVGQVRVAGDNPRDGMVVYLEGTEEKIPDRAKSQIEIRQKDRQFVPQLAVVPVGSVIDFPNEDRIFHNVFSLSRARRFDLGLYREGSSRSVTFGRPGVVEIYCNIHPEMVAHVVVLDTVHFDVTEKNGRFVLPNVPAGTYELVVWQRYGEEVREKVTVDAGGATRLQIEVAAPGRHRRHMRKDGTPYGRYR